MLQFISERSQVFECERGLRGWPMFEAAVYAGKESISTIINPYIVRYKPDIIYVYSERGFLWFKGHKG